MANNKTYTEYKFLTVVDRKFGRELLSRMEKLDEEVSELFEAFGDAYNGETGLTNNRENIDHLLDEVADTFGVLTQVADILGMNQRDMFERVLDKLKHRETYPEYKKQKSIVN